MSTGGLSFFGGYGLLLLVKVAGDLVPVWPFALFLGLTAVAQVTAGRRASRGTSRRLTP